MMRRIVVGLVVISAFGARRSALGQAAAVAERVVSVGSLVAGEGPLWSPDGSRILYPSSLGGGAIWSVGVDGGAPVRVTREIATGLVRLAPRGDVLVYLSDKGGNPEIWLWNLAAGTDRRLTNLGARINALSWSPDGKTIAFSALRYGQFDLWSVDVATGKVLQVTSDPRYETYPVWTPDGRSLLYIRSDDRWADHEIMMVPAAGGASRVIATDQDLFDYGTMSPRARFGYPLLSPDGKSVLFRSHRSGWINYWVAGLDGGAPRQLAPEAADQSDAKWSPDGSSVVFASLHNGTQDLRIVAATGGAARIVVPVTRGVAASPEWSPDGSKIAFTLATPTRPADLYLVAAAGGATKALTTSITPEIEKTLIAPEKVTYQSDGFTITGYLYRPALIRPGEKLPGILYIHGGPTGQFSDTYLPQAQFLAQMGYAVLAPNIRGSSGYGKAFEDANNPCWTHCDLRDVVQGVALLKTLPYVQASRMGITGNSYGGIMSMGAIAHAPGVFQAAAPQSGYADWIGFQSYNTELQHSKLNAYEWGPYPDSAAVYRRNSSIFSAAAVTTPAFVLHGDGVTQAWRPGVYPIPASLEFVHALDRLNKVVKYKVYPGETYYVGGRENSKQVLLDLLEWFDQYLKDS
ncbi:MAG: S9 family peptidase [Gemmatimonadetes bacterium]|nr:S9 family peptidase [Gemmatimonadota bacterium]